MLKTNSGPGDLGFLTWLPASAGSSSPDEWQEGFEAIQRHLQTRGATLLHCRCYGDLEFAEQVLSTFEDLPIRPTFVEGHPCSGRGLAGIHAITALPAEPEAATTLEWEGEFCGQVVRGREAEYLYLSDVTRFVPPARKETAGDETEAVFEVAKAMLEGAGWEFGRIFRTWFYLRDILEWYDAFNAARNRIFTRFGLFDPDRCMTIPASTGIEGRNHHNSWCTLDLLATRPVGTVPLSIDRLANPKQNEAPDYGSAFSRGLAVTTGHTRYVVVSGTASINDQGDSIHLGDFVRQTEVTMDTVEALLGQGGAAFENVVQATAFVKRPEDVGTFQRIVENSHLKDLPLVCMIADVCRDDLLFELDATAVLPAPSEDEKC